VTDPKKKNRFLQDLAQLDDEVVVILAFLGAVVVACMIFGTAVIATSYFEEQTEQVRIACITKNKDYDCLSKE